MENRHNSPGEGQQSTSTGTSRVDYTKKTYHRKKVCFFCQNPEVKIDYKDAKALRPFITERGRIIPKRISGNCARHQRQLSLAIKRARNLAILPFTTISM